MKVIILLLLTIRLLRLSRTANFPLSSNKPQLALLLLILTLSIANQLVNLLLFKRTPVDFRMSPPLYMSSYYLDLVLMCALTIQVLVMRRLELEALVAMGVFKDLQGMNDREMFTEYDKMLK